MSSETLGQRLPAALLRIGRFLGSDQAAKLNREFLADLMAIHAAARDAARELEAWKPVDGEGQS